MRRATNSFGSLLDDAASVADDVVSAQRRVEICRVTGGDAIDVKAETGEDDRRANMAKATTRMARGIMVVLVL